MSDNEHVTTIREALEEAHNLTFEGDTIGIRRVLSGPQNVYLDALADELAEANARAARLDDEALIELVAESMWRPIFGGNLAGQSFAERAPYLRSIWLRHAQHAVSAMRAFVAGNLDAAPGDTEGKAQP